MLYMFDLDGTLIESYLEDIECPACFGTGTGHDMDFDKPCPQCHGRKRWTRLTPVGYDQINWLPRRLEVMRELHHRGHKLAICTNQTGVHYGYQTPEQVILKLGRVASEIGAYVDLRYAVEPGPFRKPNPGMLFDAMKNAGVTAQESIFVGDMWSDEEAAANAGVPFCWADIFFEGPRRAGLPLGPIPDRLKGVHRASQEVVA